MDSKVMGLSTEFIWQSWSKQLKAYVLKRIPDPTFADDILQEVFIKIHGNIDTLKDDTKINQWIYQITRNTIYDYYRKQKIKPSNIQDISEIELNAFEEAETTPEERSTEIAAFGMRLMINVLPEKYAQALNMVELQGLSQVQLAKELNISVSAAKSRVQRGRQMLKDSMMKCCHYEFDKYGTVLSSHPISCCCCSKSN